MIRKFIWPLGALCALVGATGGGLVLLGLGTVWSTGWGKDLFAPGATMMTVALTAYIAAQSVVKWQEQRERDRETAEYKHRQEVYEALGTYMLNRLTAQPTDMVLDAQLRTKAALWGSAETIATLSHWQQFMASVLENHGIPGGGAVSPNETERFLLQDAFGRALEAMRADLAPATGRKRITRGDLLTSIFNR